MAEEHKAEEEQQQRLRVKMLQTWSGGIEGQYLFGRRGQILEVPRRVGLMLVESGRAIALGLATATAASPSNAAEAEGVAEGAAPEAEEPADKKKRSSKKKSGKK